jgi:hypothetical protein
MQVVELNVPPVVPAFKVNVTVPEGMLDGVVVSVTVAEQEEVCPGLIEPGLQETLVEVPSFAAPTMVTEYVTLWVWVVGLEVVKVAVPVIVTEKVVVEVTVPLKVITSVNFPPAVNVTGLVVGVTVRPVPPVIVEVRVTGPANPAELTPAAIPEGRLPIVKVSVVEPPDAKLRLGPVGVPFEVVMLKSWGRMRTVIACVFVWAANTPLSANVPEELTLSEYEPEVVAGRKSPPVKVSVADPDAPGMDVRLSAATRGGLVVGPTAPFANVTVPVYPLGVTTIEATPLDPAGQALPWLDAGHQKGLKVVPLATPLTEKAKSSIFTV